MSDASEISEKSRELIARIEARLRDAGSAGELGPVVRVILHELVAHVHLEIQSAHLGDLHEHEWSTHNGNLWECSCGATRKDRP